MPEKQTVKTECASCHGTGVYHGFAEPKGVGVICFDCNGTGCRELSYTPFSGRKERQDIEIVSLSRGRFICGPCGPGRQSITYEEFLTGKMPKVKETDEDNG